MKKLENTTLLLVVLSFNPARNFSPANSSKAVSQRSEEKKLIKRKEEKPQEVIVWSLGDNF